MAPPPGARYNDRVQLPEDFTRRIVDVFRDEGRAWLDALPALLAACEARWELTLGQPFPLSYNYVASATRRDGTEIVLKLGLRSRELRSEIAALRHYDGRGSVQLLDSDEDAGILLLERIRPGTLLDELDDNDAETLAAASLMRELWRPPPASHSFPAVADWGRAFARARERFDGGSGPLPAALFARAEARFAELQATQAPPVLLHGDLHHWNILRAQRRPWLAIDPEGVVGEPAYEAGALLRNPWLRLIEKSDAERVLARRIDILADELGLERERLAGWGFAQAVLSACWTVEDHETGWEYAIAVAGILERLDKLD